MLLYGQLQDGLLYTLMELPSVSDPQCYKELCTATKGKKRLAGKQQYLKGDKLLQGTNIYFQQGDTNSARVVWKNSNREEVRQSKSLRCYVCDSPYHLARDCPQSTTESQGKRASQVQSQAPPGTKVVKTATLQKSGLHCAKVKIEGVITTGLIDTGSDITIMRGDLFYQIITATGLGEQALKKTDQKACTYDQKPITLDGQMEMEVVRKPLLPLCMSNY